MAKKLAGVGAEMIGGRPSSHQDAPETLSASEVGKKPPSMG